MAKRRTLDEQLAALKAMANREIDPEDIATLRRALRGANNVLAGKAAQIVGRRGIASLYELLPETFERFLADSPKKDKQCRAKTEVVTALRACDIPAGDVFLQGARFVQMEPAYGGPVDTAVALRVESALGLAAMLHPDALPVLTDLLVDPEPSPRAAAAQALSYVGGQAAALLLRLKIRTGEPDPEVLAACFEALLSVDPRDGVALVAGYLDSADSDVAQSAALALGEHGGEAGLAALLACWERTVLSRARQLLVLPIALSRCPAARAFLLEIARNADPALAASAVEALGIYRADAAFAEEVRQAALGRNEPRIAQAFAATFG
jgi:hypothetical protein